MILHFTQYFYFLTYNFFFFKNSFHMILSSVTIGIFNRQIKVLMFMLGRMLKIKTFTKIKRVNSTWSPSSLMGAHFYENKRVNALIWRLGTKVQLISKVEDLCYYIYISKVHDFKGISVSSLLHFPYAEPHHLAHEP